MEDGTVRECKECVHYRDGRLMNDTCLACRHEYGAHDDEDAEEMDYPKRDYFERKCEQEVKNNGKIY